MREYAHRQTAALLRKLATQVNRASGDQSPDAIHDLRVAIRRLSRGVRVFAPFYRDGSWKVFRAQLSYLLHAAGAVRDRDIAIECLEDAGVSKRAAIVTRLRAERRKAGQEFAAEVRLWKANGLTRRWRQRLGV